MDLEPKQIATKEVVGELDGNKVWHVASKGGWHMLVSMDGGHVKPLGAGNHQAYARHLAKQRHPKLKLAALAKSQDLTIDELSRDYELSLDLTNRLAARNP
jgi:hypothetical protein